MSSAGSNLIRVCLFALVLPFSVSGTAVDSLPVSGSALVGQQTELDSTGAAGAVRLLDRALYRFQNGNLGGALDNLNRIARENPEFKPVERLVLTARCRLAQGDSAAFDSSYAAALAVSVSSDDFSVLLQDLRLIMTSSEADRMDLAKTAAEKAEFFRRFWKSRDPDPISERNERLIEHYTRLRDAEQNYSHTVKAFLLPTSRNHSPAFERDIDETSPLVDYPYPLPSRDQEAPRQLELDQRGVLYLRHGPPDRIERQGDGGARTVEVWHYGNAMFRFEGREGAGNFISMPTGDANPEMLLAEETSALKTAQVYQDYYAAEFRAPDGRLELEFYQSLPVSAAREAGKVEAAVGLFDSTWTRMAADFSTARRVFTGRDSLIVSVNRLVIPPGDYYSALRMAVPPRPAVIRSSLHLNKYPAGTLELSGIIFGSPPDPHQPVHERRGVEILPRPSLAFHIGETVSVFYEIYGLGTNAESQRTYRELVTVSIASANPDEQNGFSGNLEGFMRWDHNRSTTLTLSFDRSIDQASGAVAENFDIDTQGLVPGNYRLYLDIEDTVNGQHKEVTWFFDLLPERGPEKP